MTSAIDTNIIVALWDADEVGHLRALRMLDSASERGRLVICGAVFGELLAGQGRTEEFLVKFLDESHISVDWMSTKTIWRTAGAAFRQYAARRRRQGSSEPQRILTDFYIGAHAFCSGYSLLTLDDKIYRTAFPKLEIIGK